MNDLPEVCFPPDATIREILQALDRTGLKVIVVVDANRRVLGMCTDGDIRRALLRDVALTSPVSTIMMPTSLRK